MNSVCDYNRRLTVSGLHRVRAMARNMSETSTGQREYPE